VQVDGQTEHCFKTIARRVDQSDDDDDDDDDDDTPIGRQMTRKCCEGWYTPEGKPLCSAKNLTKIEHKTATGCENLEKKLEEFERLARGSRVSVGYLFIRYVKGKIASLEEKNRRQEEKIKNLEEQLLNLTLNIQTVEVVESKSPTERAAISTVDPCDSALCPDHPEAMCMVTSRCGKDIAVFVDENLRTVRCNSSEPCNLLPRTFCPDDPCLGLQCVGYPEAFCIVTECDCSPSFVLPDGTRPTCANKATCSTHLSQNLYFCIILKL